MRASRNLNFRRALGGFFLAGALFASAGLAQDGFGSGERPRALLDDNGLMLDLSAHGLQSIVELVRKELLSGSQEVTLPDMHRVFLGGTALEARGVKLSFGIQSLAAVPKPGRLELKAAIQDLRVHVGEMRLAKSILGIPVAASCLATQFRLGSAAAPVHFSSDIEATVIDRNVILGSRNTTFPVSFANYRVEGPRACSGGPLWGELLGLTVHSVLAHAHPFIETLVVKQIDKMLPALGDKLTEQSNLALTVDIHDLPPLPERMVTISAYPRRLTMGPDSVRIVVGMDFRDAERDLGRAALRPRPLAGAPKLGALGFNPHLLTELFQVIFAEGTPEIEIDGSVMAQVRDVLKIESAAAIWPDLTHLDSPEDHLRLFASMKTMPELLADDASKSITIHAPQIDLRFVAHDGGDWRDYFDMKLDVEAGIGISLVDGALALSLAPGGVVGVSGDWAADYSPRIPAWERDVASLLFSVVLEYLVGQGPLFRIDLPELDIAGLRIALDQPKVVAPFVLVDLVEAQ